MFPPLIVALVAPMLLSLLALGMGWILSSFVPMSLMEATWLWTANFAIVVAVIAYSSHYSHFLDDYFSEEEFEEDDDDGDNDELPF